MATTSGTKPLPNAIQNTQNQTDNYDASHIICNSDGTIDVKGEIIFDPPLPVADASKIFSPDLSSQLQCINGAQITVLGELQGYSTTAQTNSSIGVAIGDLSSVYVALTTPLDQITQPTGTLQMNNQQIDGLSDPTDIQMAVNVNFLTNNYYNIAQSDQNIQNAIGGLSTVYQSINTTLDAIPVPTGSLDMNSQKIVNLLAGTQPTDAVNLSQLDGYIPVTGNINSLTAQTANYDTSGFQLTVSNAPTANNDLTNKLYVDGEISALSTVYQSIDTTLDAIPLAVNNMDFNGQKLQNIGMNIDATDAVRQDYLTTYYLSTGDAANIYQSIANMVNYVQTSFLTSNYYTQTYINSTFATIASLSSYVTGSSLATTLADYVTSAFLTANYYTISDSDSIFATIPQLQDFSIYVNATFATIASLSNYVTSTFLTANYYTQTYINSTFATIASLSSYVTSSSLATTLTGYLQIANIGAYTTTIQTNTSGTKSKVDASTNSQILFNIADVQKLRMYVPSGQSTQPLGLIADDKIQMVSNLNSMSFTGNAALQAKPAQNYTGLYIQGQESATLNVGCQICVQPGSSSQNLTLSSGHTDIAGVQVPYSTLSNAAGSIQNNLQLSGGTPQTDNTLVLYSNSYATTLGQVLTAQFTGRTGYSTTTTITQANQFTSKTYVDSAVSGLSSVYLTIANAASTYLTIANAASTYQTIANMSNYYTKGQADALFATIASLSNYVTNSSLATTLSSYLTISSANATYVLQTTPLNDLAVPTGDLAMEGFEIKGLQLIPSIASSAASKSYVDSQIAGGGLTKAVADTYYYSFANTNLPTQSLNMNSQKIIGLGNATLATDALNRQTADGRYYSNTVALSSISVPTASLSLNNQKITDLATPTLSTDATTKAYVDAKAPFKTAIINVGTFRTTTTPIAVTSVSGFVTSATKVITPLQTAPTNYVVINYADFGYIPLLLVTVSSSVPTFGMQQNLITSSVFSVSSTQATILFGVHEVSGMPSYTSVTWQLNILAMSNTLT